MAGFIEGYGPLHNPGSSHLRRYRVADPFLRFFFRFIQPVRKRIKQLPHGLPLHQALPDRRYEVFRGLALEHLCYHHAHLIAQRLGFSAVLYEYGSWFRKGDLATGAQVDLLFRRADRVLTLCEVKFAQKVGTKVIKEVEQKVQALAAMGRYTVERVLITVHPPTQNLLNEGYFNQVLTVEELFG